MIILRGAFVKCDYSDDTFIDDVLNLKNSHIIHISSSLAELKLKYRNKKKERNKAHPSCTAERRVLGARAGLHT